MSIFCKTCGASNEDDALFCSSCGNAFEQKKPDPVPAEPVIPTASEPVSVPVSEPAAKAPVNEAPPASADPAQNQGFNAPPQGAPYNNQTPPPPPPPYMGGYNAFGGTPNNGNVSFGEAISLYFKNYANFKGRASKSEFWYSYLFTLIIGMVLGFIGSFCSTFVIELTNASFEEQAVINLVFNSLSNLFSIATFIPSLAVAVRRLHDTGKSGGYFFISLIPIVGIILLIIQLAKDSEWDNQWGPGNPQNSRPPVSFYTAVTYVTPPPYGAPYGQQPPVYNNPYQNPYQNNQQGGNYPPNQPPMA